MNAGGVGRRLIKKFDGVREGEIGIAGNAVRRAGEGRVRVQCDTLLDKDGAARWYGAKEIAAMARK